MLYLTPHRNRVQFTNCAATVIPVCDGGSQERLCKPPRAGKFKSTSLGFLCIGVGKNMSAEQLHHRLDTPNLFHLDPLYKRSRPSILDKVELWGRWGTNIKQFDLLASFESIAQLQKIYGEEQGIFLASLGAAMNLLTLRQEMLGSVNTQEIITQVIKDPEDILIRSTHYGRPVSLQEESFLNQIPRPLRTRFNLEVKQLQKLFTLLVEQVRAIDFSLRASELEAQLKQNGFRKQKIALTPQLLSTIPSIAPKSLHDFTQLIKQKETIEVYVSPSQSITVSPPSWVHRKEETSLIWGSELCVIPTTGEMFIRQQGKFSQTKEENLLRFLEYQQTIPKVFSCEEDFLLFINLVQQESYCQPHQLLELIIAQIDSFPAVPPMDPSVATGNLEIADYLAHIHEVFRFEWEHSQKNPQSTGSRKKRFDIIADLIKHQVARNEPRALREITNEYKKSFSQKNPRKTIENVALTADPGFSTRINFGMLDCVVGTPMSLMGQGNLNLEANFGPGTTQLLKHYHENGLKSRAQLLDFCKRVGKDPDPYTKYDTCPMCGQLTFVWPREEGGCNVCPVCELMDSHGLERSSFEEASTSKHGNNLVQRHKSTRQMGLSDFVTSLASPQAVYPQLH